MKRPFRKRRWDRVAFAVLLLVIAAVLVWRQPSTVGTAGWLPPGSYRAEQVIDERHLRLCSRTHPNLHATVRLLGIAAPEPWPDQLRAQAIQRLTKLAKHRTVQLRLDRRRISPDGQLLGYVFVGERLLNADLVEQGLAVAATRPEDCHTIVRQIERAESIAKTAQLGIWQHVADPRRPTDPSTRRKS